jgi:BRCA1-associated protein
VLANDRRLDKLSLECIDMVLPETANRQHDNNSDNGSSNNNNNNHITKGIGTSIIGGPATKGKYVPLDREASESVWGIVHLYRDAEATASLYDEEDSSYLKGSSIARNTGTRIGGTNQPFRIGHGVGDGPSLSVPSSDDCTTLCILAVPSYLSPSDFLGFVGEETRDQVSHFRMIRTARANRYMVLMKFRSGRKAREWQRDWNGKVFNSMEVSSQDVLGCFHDLR